MRNLFFLLVFSFVFILVLIPVFTFGQGIGVSSGASVVANSGYIIVSGKVANAGNLNIQNGTLTTSGNYTNSGTFTQGTGSVIFNGQNQVLSDNGSGTAFTNVFFSGNGGSANPDIMSSGSFSVSSTGILNMVNATTLNANGNLSLLSDAMGSATVAAIPSVASITGNVNAQRYITAGSGYRGYRSTSSPVNAGTVGSNKVYSVNYLQNTVYITGTSGAAGGFDKQGNPTIYLFRQDLTPSNTSFVSGNWWGISALNNSPNYNYTVAGQTASGAYNIPVGNGFLFFFRGNRAAASVAAETQVSYIPQPATLTATGALNQGQVVVSDWNTPASPNLAFTGTGTGTNYTIRGFNLLGNPYASSIDWETLNFSTQTSGMYGQYISTTVYEFNPATSNFDTYKQGGAYTNHGSKIIVSGEGFFVLATDPTQSTFIFNESAKSTVQSTGLNLFMGKPVNNNVNSQYLRLQLAKDSINTDDILIQFNKGAKTEFDEIADAPYKKGSGKVSLSSFSSDQVSLAINVQPLPKQGEKIDLNINTTADGVYQLNMKELVGIPQLFDVWLMDAYKKDSLDMRHNSTYSFNVYKNDTSSFGANRFSLFIHQNPAYAYSLLNFTAVKVPGANQVQVVWNTENEENYTNFTIERSTDGGKTFDVVGGVSATGAGNYGLLDKHPVTGQNLYRLKQEDINSAITYSKVVTIQYSNLSDNITYNLNLFPNPASSSVNLAIISATDETATYNIKFVNSSGAVVKEVNSPQLSWQGNISSLKPGTYFVRVFSNKDQSIVGRTKFVKL